MKLNQLIDTLQSFRAEYGNDIDVVALMPKIKGLGELKEPRISPYFERVRVKESSINDDVERTLYRPAFHRDEEKGTRLLVIL